MKKHFFSHKFTFTSVLKYVRRKIFKFMHYEKLHLEKKSD